MTKKLTIKERVDLLLKEGIDNPKKWAAVHGYEEPTWQTNDSHGWAKEYRKLRDHHLEETAFLFEMLREMANRLDINPKVGDKVTIPWTDYGIGCDQRPEHYTLVGTITRISGAYHYVKIHNNPKYDILELYPNEFKVVR